MYWSGGCVTKSSTSDNDSKGIYGNDDSRSGIGGKVKRQKKPTESFCKKRSSQKFCKIHRKTPAPEPLF